MNVATPATGEDSRQTFLVAGERIQSSSSEVAQRQLAPAHAAHVRPMCLCTAGGVAMYIARIAPERYIIKRMPDTGMLHAPSCPSYLPPETLSALRARRLRNSTAGLARSLRGMGQGAHEYVGGRLAELRSGALFLAGERDPKYVEVARRSAASAPGARCVVVPGAGHTVHLEAGEAFAEAIAAHWNVAPPAERAEAITP